ncbi:nucleotidyltransferase family protein [Phenylobacterium aquaticum]|uniref:nucleotidyltransferase family protein n=1 Tax=Phenylobacterium aquaticum TaxID=1763816 RepID=UPI001F5C4F13|nr:nucleotidyltransferase family protein [Phenylobacterium aquaticum]MCI3132679.1 nucleotidyltransferase family protein [Phenylobacterium aquaticum]
MKALVLAAGLGSRIRGVAGDKPKPLLRFGDRSILAHNLRWLAASGVTEVWINLHYGAQMIREEIGDGAAFRLRIRYVYEPELLGTAGALGNIAEALTETMLVVYGDSVVRFDLAALLAAHRGAGAEATVALFDQERHFNTGIAGGRVRIDAEGAITEFVEGVNAGALSSLVNAGVYAVEPAILDLIPQGAFADFGRDVFPAMLAGHRPLRGHVLDAQGYCLGLDTPESYAAGQKLLAEGRLAAA